MSAPSLSSTLVLRRTLLWSAAATGALVVVGAVVGLLIAGVPGLWSALVAVLTAAVFLAMTAGSILLANRWYGDALFVPIFFGSVMGAWILKFVLFLVVLFVVRDQPWLVPLIFLVALVVSILASLAIDVVVMLKMRIPHASDVTLPTAADIDPEEAPKGDSPQPRD
ncbi:hypothetical protein [Microbacterium dauci]|uniref:ATP synthase protein I n=1 Tax=Microbacterium dauci TaxID=3048008 RepID=A0ABT6ZAS9_9MICO|nr:hypothetical protein [Microbacterium sp. LX3-4]MDJ1113038.1 hypothetical protein [Microbacterium sp. LX3-4]